MSLFKDLKTGAGALLRCAGKAGSVVSGATEKAGEMLAPEEESESLKDKVKGTFASIKDKLQAKKQ